MTIELGRKAPDFTLPCCDGERVETFQLNRNLGSEKIILAFFPLAFTPVCTDEMCQLSDELARFQQLSAKVYGISVDSPFALNAFIKAHDLKIKLLSDFNREVSHLFGVLHEELMGLRGIAKRSVFVLDKDGTVRYRWVSDDPGVMPDLNEIHQALQGD
jgi:peroxiredoxin